MTISRLLTATVVALALIGCGGEQNPEETTISPATPPPAAVPTDTDLALTQTTEVGEDRSPNEGGILTDPSYGGTATTTDTAAPDSSVPLDEKQAPPTP